MRGWRKFSVTAASLLMSFVLALYGLLTADFALIVSIVNGAFAAGNAVEHMSNARRNAPQPQSEL